MTPNDRRRLFAARELVEVALTSVVLDALLLALEAEHHTLDELPETGDPPSLCRARHVVRLARRLSASLRTYRSAVEDALRSPCDDDLPF